MAGEIDGDALLLAIHVHAEPRDADLGRKESRVGVTDGEVAVVLGEGNHPGHGIERGDARITLHLAGVSFVDSVGVSVLVTAAERAERAGGRLQLREPSSAVRKMLEARGLETRFPVV